MNLDNLNLPKEAYVNKFIPKNKFYGKAALSSKLQKEFSDKIQKITWKYKIAEDTIGISTTDKVTEIQIFEIHLKEQIIPKKVLKIIDKSIPYQILYRFVYNDEVTYGITLKESNKVENYYFSEWNEGITFDFTGINLEKVYQKLVRAFISNIDKHSSSFSDVINRDTRIKSLEKEIVRLKSKMNSEKQFNRKVVINKILLEKKTDLKRL
jgi:hypothetical protein